MEIWRQEFKEAAHYHSQVLIDAGCEKYSVQRMDSDAPPRIFDRKGQCNCHLRVAFLFPCAHEICAEGYSFVLSQVDKRWFKRATITSSFATENPNAANEPNTANEITEEIHPSDDDDALDGIEFGQFHNSQLPTQDENVSTQTEHQVQRNPSRSRGQEYNKLMGLCQQLMQAAAGTKFGSIVGGIVIQLTKVIEGRANVEIGDGSWPSVVKLFV